MFRTCTRGILPVLLLVAATAASAQQQRYSYHDPTPDAVRTIRTVERNHFDKGMTAMEAGKWELARAEWDFILRYVPNHPRVLYLMAQTAVQAGRPEWVDEYFTTAMRLYPDVATTYSVYGVHLHRRGELQAAIEAYEKALSIAPASPETHYNLGMAYAAADRLNDANWHAQLAYYLNYPLPGLRNRLQRAGAWETLPAEELAAAVSATN